MKAFKKSSKFYSRPLLIGSMIFIVLALHFAVSQFIALDNYKDFSVSRLIYGNQPITLSPSSRQPQTAPVAVKTEVEIKQAETAVINEKVSAEEKQVEQSQPKVKARPRRTIEKETVTKRKQVAPSPSPSRETRAERLRRTEKILTGV